MQQWDALHAMLVYESLEIRESLDDESEEWKLAPIFKGLGCPFLLKVQRPFYLFYFLLSLRFLFPPLSFLPSSELCRA